MKLVSIVLTLLLFGTVCSSYAIDCMDVWDEESIAEMIEDDRRYEESLNAEHEDDDDAHPIDNEDDTLADTHDEEEDEHEDHAHEHHANEDHANEDHESNVGHSVQDQRHKRESPLVAQSIAEEVVNEDPSDLETAETHLFRPVFRYKSQYTERRRVRTPNGGVNFAPTQ